jgi:hypothetical protein
MRSAPQTLCAQLLDAAFSRSKAPARNKKALGKGRCVPAFGRRTTAGCRRRNLAHSNMCPLPRPRSGFLWEQSPFCSYAERDGVHVLFHGEVGELPGNVNVVNAAHDAFLRNEPPLEANDASWVLDLYQTFSPVGAAHAYLLPGLCPLLPRNGGSHERAAAYHYACGPAHCIRAAACNPVAALQRCSIKIHFAHAPSSTVSAPGPGGRRGVPRARARVPSPGQGLLRLHHLR